MIQNDVCKLDSKINDWIDSKWNNGTDSKWIDTKWIDSKWWILLTQYKIMSEMM